MFGGIDPKKMQQVMKQMGIKQEEVEALRVVVERVDGVKTIIENPSVVKIMMQGQESWQISGEAHDEEASGFSEEDVRLVIEKTGKSEKEARKALEDADGEVAGAIISLS